MINFNVNMKIFVTEFHFKINRKRENYLEGKRD
jgi:hypothetical protein